MMLIFLSFLVSTLKENDHLITHDLVNRINYDSQSTFTAKLNRRFMNMTIGDSRRFLSPVMKIPLQHGSSRPIGANISEYSNFSHVITGYTNEQLKLNEYKFTVYNNQNFCSSWATAVTSAMSLSLSIHSKKLINLSIQYIIDCDIFGDSCMQRPALNSYEPFYRRFIPQTDQWDQNENVLRSPPKNLTDDICKDNNGCFPNLKNCQRNQVLSGECNATDFYLNCPVYLLNNWKWMQSHLWEVGPITSSIFVKQSLFTYDGGIYSSESKFDDKIIGMMDVTIIGWGKAYQIKSEREEKWWYVIPHLGTDFGETAGSLFNDDERKALGLENPNQKTGIMRFNMSYDDSGIESQSIGAVPYNFIPKTLRMSNKT